MWIENAVYKFCSMVQMFTWESKLFCLFFIPFLNSPLDTDALLPKESTETNLRWPLSSQLKIYNILDSLLLPGGFQGNMNYWSEDGVQGLVTSLAFLFYNLNIN